MFQLVPTMFLQWLKPSSRRCCLTPKALVKTQAQAKLYNPYHQAPTQMLPLITPKSKPKEHHKLLKKKNQ